MSRHSGPKKSVSSEVTALHKQVADLKASALERRRVEDALRAAETLHRCTLDEAPIGVLRLDPSGRVLYANPAIIKALGYGSRQDFTSIGELRGVFVNGEEARRVIDAARGGTAEVTAQCVRREGEPRMIRLVAGAVTEDGVTLVCFRLPADS
jgi:PAS domain-containing protein